MYFIASLNLYYYRRYVSKNEMKNFTS
jgi:hypothetical protein